MQVGRHHVASFSVCGPYCIYKEGITRGALCFFARRLGSTPRSCVFLVELRNGRLCLETTHATTRTYTFMRSGYMILGDATLFASLLSMRDCPKASENGYQNTSNIEQGARVFGHAATT